MLTDLSIADLSSSALLGLTVLMILTGRLVPRRVLKDKTEEAERWRKAYEAERTARGIVDAQRDELLESARTTSQIVQAMAQTSATIRQRSGEPDASMEA